MLQANRTNITYLQSRVLKNDNFRKHFIPPWWSPTAYSFFQYTYPCIYVCVCVRVCVCVWERERERESDTHIHIHTHTQPSPHIHTDIHRDTHRLTDNLLSVNRNNVLLLFLFFAQPRRPVLFPFFRWCVLWCCRIECVCVCVFVCLCAWLKFFFDWITSLVDQTLRPFTYSS